MTPEPPNMPREDAHDVSDAACRDPGPVPEPRHGDHGHALVTLREDEHLGCHIEIKTTYEITVNGAPYHGHLMLDNDGDLYTHACPYSKFGSAMDLVKHLIRLYPESFPVGDAPGDSGHPGVQGATGDPHGGAGHHHGDPGHAGEHGGHEAPGRAAGVTGDRPGGTR